MVSFKYAFLIVLMAFALPGFALQGDIETDQNVVIQDEEVIKTLMQASCSDGLCVATGTYFDPVLGDRPLFVKTNDAGSSWQVMKSIPNMPSRATFRDISCSKDTCVAIGYYYKDNSPDDYPFIAQSRDYGNTWEIVTRFINQPLISKFASVNCSINLCAVVGVAYEDKSLPPKPLIVRSIDKGVTWEIFQLGTHENYYWVGGVLNSVSCDTQLCVAAGNLPVSNTDGKTRPFAIKTNNAGKSWGDVGAISYTQYGTGAKQPSLGGLSKASCSGTVCAVAGFTVHPDGKSSLPLVVISKDSATTWKENYVFPTNGSIPKDISCAGQFCIVGGSDAVTKAPLVAQTYNAGNSWELIKSIPNAPSKGDIGVVSCSDWFCAAGGYATYDVNAPSLLEKMGDRMSWRFPSVFNPSVKGTFYDTACTNSLCIGIGYTSNGTSNVPFLVESIDGGPWNFVNL
jgi:hypothetical protein